MLRRSRSLPDGINLIADFPSVQRKLNRKYRPAGKDTRFANIRDNGTFQAFFI
jgi:hypothetical protein